MASAMSEATLSYELWQDYSSKREEWAKRAAEDEDFYMGRQWTDEEIGKLQERGMAPIVVNRIMPIIQQEVSTFLATRPYARYFPMEDGDVRVASIFNTMFDYVWQGSDGDRHAINAALDFFTIGAGYLQVYVDRYADWGNGEVRWRRLVPWDVYPDPNSRETDLSDARYIIVSRLVERSSLLYMYPDKADAIAKAETEDGPAADRPPGNSSLENDVISISDYTFNQTGEESSKIRLIERHELIRKPMIKVIDLVNGSVTVHDPKVFNPEGVQGIRIQKVWKTQEKVTITAGKGVKLFTYVNDIPMYSIVPAYLHHRGTPYAMGDVGVTKGQQQEINKRRSIVMHNSTLAGNYRMMAEKGSITNRYEWETQGSRPGFVLEYIRGTNGDPPREMLPQPLPPGVVQLEQEAKQDLEYTVSVFAHQMGSTSDAPNTYRGLLALEENGQKKIHQKAKPLNLAFRNVGRLIMYFAQRTYKAPKMVRVVGDTSKGLVETMINEIVVDESGQNISRMNDITVGKYDLMVMDGTTMPSNRMAMLNLYMEMYQMGIVDKAEVIKKTDILDREELLQRVGEVQQMQAQVAQMEEAMKNTEGLNQTLRRQLQQAMVKLEAVKGAQSVKDEVTLTKTHQKLTRDRMDDSLKILKEKQKLREAEADLAIQAFMDRQKIELEKAKLDAKKKKEAANG